MTLAVPTDVARPPLAASVEAFLAAVDGLDEMALLGASRCHGWTRLDVVVHVLGGWHEVLAGLVSPVDDVPTVDAASYWTAFASAAADEDPVAEITAQRRRSSAYARPSAAVAQLHDVGAAVLRGAASAPVAVLPADDQPPASAIGWPPVGTGFTSYVDEGFAALDAYLSEGYAA